MNTAVRAAVQKTENHGGGFGGTNTKGEAPTNTPSMHGIEGKLKVNLGSGENDKVINIELANVTEGVRGGEGHTRDGRAKSDSETVNKQIEEKRKKNSVLRDARVDPRWRNGATKTYLGQGTTQKFGRKVPAFLMSMNATKVCS